MEYKQQDNVPRKLKTAVLTLTEKWKKIESQKKYMEKTP